VPHSRSGRRAVQKRKIFCHYRESHSGRPNRSPLHIPMGCTAGKSGFDSREGHIFLFTESGSAQKHTQPASLGWKYLLCNFLTVKVKVKITLRLAVNRQSVCLGVKPLETYDQRFPPPPAPNLLVSLKGLDAKTN
jgi:hypothetical protein